MKLSNREYLIAMGLLVVITAGAYFGNNLIWFVGMLGWAGLAGWMIRGDNNGRGKAG